MMRKWVLLSVLMVVVVCSGGSALAAEGFPFWAMHVGNWWEYDGYENGGSGTWTWYEEVTGTDTTTFPGHTVYVHDCWDDWVFAERRWFEVDPTQYKMWGVMFYDDGVEEWVTITADNPLVYLRNPIIVTDNWNTETSGTIEFEYSGTFDVTISLDAIVMAREAVVTPLGTYMAYKIGHQMHIYDGGGFIDVLETDYMWVVPYLGKVKWADESDWEIEELSVVTVHKGMGDLDTDAKTDIGVYHNDSGLWFGRLSTDGSTISIGYGGAGYNPAPGDYDGDGLLDVAVYHSASGLWFIHRSSDDSDYYVGYGGSAYTPVPSDYDGDGTTDIAVYHSSSGLWYIRKSSDLTTYYLAFGGPDYSPVPGDYDGDGKTDIAVYHASSGLWFVHQSSDDSMTYVGYGGSGYVPVPGDYDGDGKADVAVYHSASGLWFIRQSSDLSTVSVGYGGADYRPVPGDYDGDGHMDVAVYYVPAGLWYIRQSSDANSYYVGYGGSGYTPVNPNYLLWWVY